jgi:hypothetical protein
MMENSQREQRNNSSGMLNGREQFKSYGQEELERTQENGNES